MGAARPHQNKIGVIVGKDDFTCMLKIYGNPPVDVRLHLSVAPVRACPRPYDVTDFEKISQEILHTTEIAP